MISWIFITTFLTKEFISIDGKVKFKEIFLTKFESITLKDITSFVMPTLLPKGFKKNSKFLKKIPKFITKKTIGIINKYLKFSLLFFKTSKNNQRQKGNKKM